MAALSKQDEQRLRDLLEKDWVQRGLERDWNALLALCAEDFVYLPPDSPTLVGKDDARAFLEGFPPAEGVGQVVTRIWGDTSNAAMHGTFEGSFTNEGEMFSARGKFLCTAKKEGSAWLLTSSCFNLDGPPS